MAQRTCSVQGAGLTHFQLPLHYSFIRGGKPPACRACNFGGGLWPGETCGVGAPAAPREDAGIAGTWLWWWEQAGVQVLAAADGGGRGGKGSVSPVCCASLVWAG